MDWDHKVSELLPDKNYSLEDIIYLAGFLDGEGCFIVQQHKIYVVCANTYKPIIEWMKNTFGGTITPSKPRKANHRVCYRWSIVANDAIKVLKKVIPYLREKQPQATLLLHYHSLKKLNGKGSGRETPVELLEERARLKKILGGMKFVPH